MSLEICIILQGTAIIILAISFILRGKITNDIMMFTVILSKKIEVLTEENKMLWEELKKIKGIKKNGK